MTIYLVHQFANKHVVYVLTLDGGRRYVGQTQNIEKRLAEHLEKRGAKWTHEHNVMDVISCRVCENEEVDIRWSDIAWEASHQNVEFYSENYSVIVRRSRILRYGKR